ncbi:uncharacterized protein BX663DRAFT_548451 [Cokeromyces recurvatus]|uniref:uncharacterized protein n=1 Tax=Cokeromyces recurvatus TaxID=90255 RepID=UPI00221FD02E|nr:uncharacterized protein BX663DRAFT_548451 [Cokeromyces recurvatus]KAI7907404.1 hypothetical protein BX663DRAFT_548451 [Cokeromyces recurvatus]
MEEDQGRITTEDGEDVMDILLKKGVKNLTNLTAHKEAEPILIKLDPEDKNVENRMEVVAEKTWAKIIKNKFEKDIYENQTHLVNCPEIQLQEKQQYYFD